MNIETLIGSIGSEFKDELVEALLRRFRGSLDTALRRIRRPQAAVGIVSSPLGDLLVAKSPRGVVLNHYLHDDSEVAAIIAKLRLEFDPVQDRRAVREVGEEVRRYLCGDAKALRQNVDLTLAGHSFQRKVLHKLQAVPRGAVISYQALGAAAGAPNGARAVGNALHDNPVPIYVPCHRVISSDGRIGGYGGGASRKLQLLRSEGFAVDNTAGRIPDGVVWGHRGTKIYCRSNCRTTAHVNRARILFFADPGQARRAGMRACKICRPA
jgi:methylated-DNA-[protein]-cysteine S-methyltransferase